MTKVLAFIDMYSDRRVHAQLRADGYEVVGSADEISVPDLVQMFKDEKADVLFIEPGMPIDPLFNLFRTLYGLMDGAPIVICSASQHEWYGFCKKAGLNVVVTTHCGMMPKNSFKEEIEEALAMREAA